jgi:hypothetical protein
MAREFSNAHDPAGSLTVVARMDDSEALTQSTAFHPKGVYLRSPGTFAGLSRVEIEITI